MHTNVSAFHIVFVESVLGGSWNALGGARTQKVMYTTCFSVFGSVFTRRNAASGVSLGDSLGDPVGDLGPHMLCTHMFQRFASFSAECVFGGSLGRTWGCLWDPQGFLVGPRGVLGAAWGYLETPWGSLVALGVFLGDSLGVLGCPREAPCRDLVPHMLRTPMFQRFLFFVALASLFEFFFILCVVFSIVLFLSFVHRILDPKTSCILAVLAHSGASSLGAVRLQGSPWETPWPTWWETWGLICYAH